MYMYIRMCICAPLAQYNNAVICQSGPPAPADTAGIASAGQCNVGEFTVPLPRHPAAATSCGAALASRGGGGAAQGPADMDHDVDYDVTPDVEWLDDDSPGGGGGGGSGGGSSSGGGSGTIDFRPEVLREFHILLKNYDKQKGLPKDTLQYKVRGWVGRGGGPLSARCQHRSPRLRTGHGK